MTRMDEMSVRLGIWDQSAIKAHPRTGEDWANEALSHAGEGWVGVQNL